MKYIVIDFETYYDTRFSLKKMTPAEYIHDPRFEVIGAAIKEPGYNPVWLDGDSLTRFLHDLPNDIPVISHNALFDMCILHWHYGKLPTLMVDTMGMARALLFAFTGKVSLEILAEYLKLPPKGAIIKSVAGMHRENMEAAGLWDQFTSYACGDAIIAEAIFLHLRQSFPKQEYLVLDTVLRCCVVPQFELDTDLMAQHLQDIAIFKDQLLARCGLTSRLELMSNERFAQALLTLGVTPPTKVSPATGKETWAFAKTDPGMIALTEHRSPQVQALVAARIGHKSTLEETRSERLLAIARLMEGRVPVPLRYSGAHTHRLSGDWKMNGQNWPRATRRPDGTKETGKIRRAHKAPEGMRVVKCDASQIEARIVAWLAGQDDLVQAFRERRDIYSEFASENIYHYPVDKTKVDERFIGKQSILGLGFQSGAPKFVSNIAAKSYEMLGRQIVLSLPEGEKIVTAYRTRYDDIPRAWSTLKELLPYLSAENSRKTFGPLVFEHQAILLPSGLRLFYHDLKFDEATGEWRFTYGGKTKKLFGGKLLENAVQALARICTMDAAIAMRRRYPQVPLAHQIHDDLVYVVPQGLVPEFRLALREAMSTPPPWAEGLPLDAEDAEGPNYGDAKP